MGRHSQEARLGRKHESRVLLAKTVDFEVKKTNKLLKATSDPQKKVEIKVEFYKWLKNLKDTNTPKPAS